MKVFLTLAAFLSLIATIYAVAVLERVDINILDKTKGACHVKINPTTPKTVDIDIESFVEAKDISVRHAAYLNSFFLSQAFR